MHSTMGDQRQWAACPSISRQMPLSSDIVATRVLYLISGPLFFSNETFQAIYAWAPHIFLDPEKWNLRGVNCACANAHQHFSVNRTLCNHGRGRACGFCVWFAGVQKQLHLYLSINTSESGRVNTAPFRHD